MTYSIKTGINPAKINVKSTENGLNKKTRILCKGKDKEMLQSSDHTKQKVTQDSLSFKDKYFFNTQEKIIIWTPFSSISFSK